MRPCILPPELVLYPTRGYNVTIRLFTGHTRTWTSMRTASPLRMLCIIVLFALPASAQADFGVNLYGLSYHLERDKARALGIDNQINPGVGIRYRIHQSPGFDWIFDAGFYRDSGRHTAKIAGAGLLWHATDHLRLGAALKIGRAHV